LAASYTFFLLFSKFINFNGEFAVAAEWQFLFGVSDGGGRGNQILGFALRLYCGDIKQM
jgi:hypothetical protein